MKISKVLPLSLPLSASLRIHAAVVQIIQLENDVFNYILLIHFHFYSESHSGAELKAKEKKIILKLWRVQLYSCGSL